MKKGDRNAMGSVQITPDGVVRGTIAEGFGIMPITALAPL